MYTLAKLAQPTSVSKLRLDEPCATSSNIADIHFYFTSTIHTPHPQVLELN